MGAAQSLAESRTNYQLVFYFPNPETNAPQIHVAQGKEGDLFNALMLCLNDIYVPDNTINREIMRPFLETDGRKFDVDVCKRIDGIREMMKQLGKPVCFGFSVSRQTAVDGPWESVYSSMVGGSVIHYSEETSESVLNSVIDNNSKPEFVLVKQGDSYVPVPNTENDDSDDETDEDYVAETDSESDDDDEEYQTDDDSDIDDSEETEDFVYGSLLDECFDLVQNGNAEQAKHCFELAKQYTPEKCLESLQTAIGISDPCLFPLTEEEGSGEASISDDQCMNLPPGPQTTPEKPESREPAAHDWKAIADILAKTVAEETDRTVPDGPVFTDETRKRSRSYADGDNDEDGDAATLKRNRSV